jgi:murein DD-endopeptidase MepM/ murein hydrolase activator NlpD
VASLVLTPVTAAVAAAPAAAVVRPLPDGSYGLSSYYGPRCQPIRGASVWHLGQDMGAGRGTDVRAISRGTVVKAGSAPGFGQVVVLRHWLNDVRWFSVYGHVVDGNRFVQTGDKVPAGRRIADVGSSGTSTSPHLHMEIWRNEYKGEGSTRDPLVWMRERGASLSRGAAWARTRSVPSSCTYYTTTNVNLRTGPGSGYRVIRTVPVNRVLTAEPGDGSGVWRRVNRAGTVGWMHSSYISPTLTSLGTLYVTANGLRLRAEPNTSSAVRATLSRGTALRKIWPSQGGWTKVYVGGRQGFVNNNYVSTRRP